MVPGEASDADQIALDRKVRSSIRGIMGWDAQEFKGAMSLLSARERRAFKNSYAAICTGMQKRNVQWSTNLMLESVDLGKKRSYVAAYPLRIAPNELERIGSLRLMFLEQLYDRLPVAEREGYGEFLSPGYLITGSIPDIRAAYVLVKLQDLQNIALRCLENRSIQSGRYLASRWERAPLRATKWHEHFFVQTVGVDQPNKDSLYARLMLNACTNNFRLQIAAIEGLRSQACAGMTKLVLHLRTVFGETLPEVRNEGDVRDVLLEAMTVPGQQSWRYPKEKSTTRILSRAQGLAGTERILEANPEIEPFKWRYLLLTTLAVAWSYCSYEKYDSGLVGEEHRVRQVMSGREDPSPLGPTLDLYHQQQFKLLWFSGQAFKLDSRQIIEHASRASLMFKSYDDQLVRLKSFSVAQWDKLGRELSSVLKGTTWDDEPHPVIKLTT